MCGHRSLFFICCTSLRACRKSRRQNFWSLRFVQCCKLSLSMLRSFPSLSFGPKTISTLCSECPHWISSQYTLLLSDSCIWLWHPPEKFQSPNRCTQTCGFHIRGQSKFLILQKFSIYFFSDFFPNFFKKWCRPHLPFLQLFYKRKVSHHWVWQVWKHNYSLA